VEAVQAAGDLGGEGFPEMLINLWSPVTAGNRGSNTPIKAEPIDDLLKEGVPRRSPALRTAIANALITRPEWAAKLLDAVEQKKIERGDLPITVARYFGTQPDKKLKKRAEDLIGAWHESNADVKALIAAKKKACLDGEPDLAQGKIAFQTTCMVCHTFLGAGQKVGPDLTGSGRSNLDALLANVIDPNQIIGNGYENIIVTTKDNRTLSGRMTEDTPDHVKLLAIGGAEQVVARDQVASLTNTHQSVMPQGFGALPDDLFRNLAWYVLAPPEEGPLTKEKKKLLSQGIEGAEAAKKKGPNWHAADWESVSLWNPQWQVIAPEFERTPVKLTEYHGRQNVLLMHPFAKDKPCALERKVTIGKNKMNQLSFYVASHDQGDWELRVRVNDEVVKKQSIGHDGERWKHIEVHLSKWAGKEVKLRLEGAATGWSWEFGYWSDVSLK
jgi:putative heme-binding domain-containing protein